MKSEYQSMPSVRKRTLKIIAKNKDEFELHYMGTYRWHLTKRELLEQLEKDIDVIAGWGEEFAKQ